MNRLNIENLLQEGFQIEVADKADSIIISFQGSIDLEEPQFVIERYFDTIHSKMLESGLKIVYCDFNALHYINSSGIKCLLKWILKNYQGMDQSQKYSFVFIINEDLKWQAEGIGFLKKLAPELISITNKLP